MRTVQLLLMLMFMTGVSGWLKNPMQQGNGNDSNRAEAHGVVSERVRGGAVVAAAAPTSSTSVMCCSCTPTPAVGQ